MNDLLIREIKGEITGQEGDFYLVSADRAVFLLAGAEGEHTLHEEISGFSYRDMKNRLRLTTQAVAATQEQFGWGIVTAVRRDLGAFIDINLPDKDVVVSLDDLPLEKAWWPKKGDKLYIKLVLDDKKRVWGHLAWQEDFWKLSEPAYDNMQNQDLRAICYRNKESGAFVYLPDNNMLGFIHPSEMYRYPRVGEELTVRVIGFRREDRSLNLSAKPRSYEMLDNDAQMILAYLEAQGGAMPFHDKSAPEAIKATFGISKGQFKKALGTLMKAKKIAQDEEGTTLL